MLELIRQNPPLRIAVVGGGQLGKMMTVAAKQMGFHVTVLDPTPQSPAAQVADRQIVAHFDDSEAIRTMATEADVITYEFEHIDSATLLTLEAAGYPVYPTPQILRVIQNKRTQKEALAAAGIPVSPFMPTENLEQAKEAGRLYGYPFLLKACTGGYDGKGNALVKSEEDLEGAFASLGNVEIMAEKFVPFYCEVSVIVVRSQDGDVRTYPLSENEHEENILRRSLVPARVSDTVSARARAVAKDVMNLFCGVGVFCVEMFVTDDDEILVNEVAPRPHNSGHYTIEACVSSQYEQQVRAITGLPLGDTTLLIPAVMVNLLGEKGHNGPALLEGSSHALALPGVHLHFYGKKQTAPQRKMGHVTVTSSRLEDAVEIAGRVEKYLKVRSEQGE
jgi:5-(carboxyamino)imidazole ribonucleotide synthase